MPYEEDYRRPCKALCACGKGFVRRYYITESNDWGQTREKYTDAEIDCENCKLLYHYEKNSLDEIEYLVPNGLSFPRLYPHLDHRFCFTDAEKFVVKYNRSIIEEMIADMTAPKHRFIKDLTYGPAIDFANSMAAYSKKKSLPPMIILLRGYLSRYEELLSSYNRKKPQNDLYEEQLNKYNKDLEIAELNSFRLHFSFDEEKSKNEIEERKFDSFQTIVNYHPSCKVDLTGHYWDSYFIKSCIDPEFLILQRAGYAIPHITIVKKYHCICSLCGKEKDVTSNDFEIIDDDGYCYPKICCDCHNVSSFEAKTMDILNNYGINYMREVSFDNLVGDFHKPLRFDFAFFDNQKSDLNSKVDYRFLLELQGPHHYKSGGFNDDGEFIEDNGDGAKKAFIKRLEYDKKKRNYCLDKGLPLEYIKYTAQKSYDGLELKIKELLIKYDFLK